MEDESGQKLNRSDHGFLKDYLVQAKESDWREEDEGMPRDLVV